MARSTKAKAKKAGSAKKKTHITAGRGRAAEYVDCLIELHKLQAALLNKLHKQL